MKDIKNKIMNNFFREVSNVVWDIQSGKLGIKTEGGIFTINKTENGEYEGLMNPIEAFSFDVPAFATRHTVGSLNPGDIIIRGKYDTPVFVTGIENEKVRVLHPEGMQGAVKAIKNTFLGGEAGIMVVQNIFGNNQMSGMLPMLMMMGEETDKKDMGMMMMVMSMSQVQGQQNNQMANMLPFLLMGDNKGSMSEKLMMMMVMSGNGGVNPLLPFMMMKDEKK